MDDPISALDTRRVHWDNDVTFTKRGIVKYIEDMLEYSSPEKMDKTWENKVNKANDF